MAAGKNGLPPTGIPYVLVGGKLIVENSQPILDNLPGQPIRYPVVNEGEIKLEYNDKQYQWHSDLSDEETESLKKGEVGLKQ